MKDVVSAHHASQSAQPIAPARLATNSRRLAEDLMAHCTECGHRLPRNAWLCTGCGSFQSEPAPAPESSELTAGSAETPAPPPIIAAHLATDSQRLAEDLTVHCTQCGHKLLRDAWLCTECGSFQSEPAATPEPSELATRSTPMPTPQPITVAALPADVPRQGPARVTSGWQWLVGIVSRSLATVD